jgi:hypothetical protein
LRPLVPRPQVHHRFREERADVLVVRELFPNLPHRRRVGLIERLAVVRLRIRIAFAQRVDQGSLDRRRIVRVLLRQL